MSGETCIAFSPTKVANINLRKLTIASGIVNGFTILDNCWSRGWGSSVAMLGRRGCGGCITKDGREGGGRVHPQVLAVGNGPRISKGINLGRSVHLTIHSSQIIGGITIEITKHTIDEGLVAAGQVDNDIQIIERVIGPRQNQEANGGTGGEVPGDSLGVEVALGDSIGGQATNGVNIGGSGGDSEVDIDDQIEELDGNSGVAIVSSTGELGALDDEIGVGLVKEVIAASGDRGSVLEPINGIDVRITPRHSLGHSWVRAAHVGEGVSASGSNTLLKIENGNGDGGSQEDGRDNASDLSVTHISGRNHLSVEAAVEGLVVKS
jgi:hypothetical protein